MNTPDFKLDHFRLYDVVDLRVALRVALRGQFERTPKPAVLQTLAFFANPVSKNREPIHDPNAHFNCYQLYQGVREPTRELLVENQFGRQKIIIGKPFALLVPAQKRGHEMPTHLDHFKLYWVLDHEPIGKTVALKDQFLADEAIVRGIWAFGVPVEKTFMERVYPVINPRDHLVVYLITPRRFTATKLVRDQFSARARTLTFLRSMALAVPSLKVEARELQ